MSYFSKWLVSIGMIIGFGLFFGFMVIEIKSSGIAIPMTYAAIVFIVLVVNLKAVWKKKE